MTNPPAPFPEYSGNNAYDPQTPAVDEGTNKLAYWALGFGVLGLVAVLTVVAAPYAAIPGLVGLVLSIIALSKSKKYVTKRGKRKGLAITGLVFSLISIIAAIAVVVLAAMMFGDCAQYESSEAVQQCIEQKLTGKA